MNTDKLLNILRYSEKNNLNMTLFRVKHAPHSTYNTGRITDNQPLFLMTGSSKNSEDATQEKIINLGIDLDVERSDIMSDGYILKDKQLELYSVFGKDSYIQVIQKQGENYEIINYKLQPRLSNPNEVELHILSRGEVYEKEYFSNFGNNSNEYGRVLMLTGIEFNGIFFKGSNYRIQARNLSGQYIKSYTLDKYEDIELSHHNSISNLYIFTSLKVYLEILKSKKYLDIKQSTIDNIEIMVAYNYHDPFYFTSLKSIEIMDSLDPQQEIFDIYLKATVEVGDMGSQKLNNFLYSPMLSFDKGISTLSYVFQTVKLPITRGVIRTSSTPSIKSCSFIIPNKEINLQGISEYHTSYYNNTLETLKNKWITLSSRAQHLWNLSPLEQNFLSINFINKYFFNRLTDIYSTRSSLENEPARIPKLFTEIFGSYEEIFGIDYMQDYTKKLNAINAEKIEYVSSRFEKSNVTLSNLGRSTSIQEYQYGFIYPTRNIMEFKGLDNNGYVAKNLLLINDTGSLTSWRPKTKKFIETIPRGTKISTKVTILNPKDKFDLMVIKKLFSGTRHAQLISNIIKDIKIPKKTRSEPSNIISYFDVNSFQGRVNLTAFTQRAQELQTENILYIEYASSKRTITMYNKTYNIDDFNFKKWNRIFKRYGGLTLRMVSAVNFKKIKEYDGFQSLENYIQTEESKKIFFAISRDYLLISDQNIVDKSFRVLNFMDFHILRRIRHSKFSAEKLKIWLTLKDEFPRYSKYIFDKITDTFMDTRNQSIDTSYNRTFLVKGTGVNAILFDQCPELISNSEIAKAINLLNISILSRNVDQTTRLFVFEQLDGTLNDLLEYSNTQNLDISENMDFVQLRNEAMLPYLTRWQKTISDFKEEGII